jgi:hypothetical protein
LFCTEKTTTDEFCCTREELKATTLVQNNMFAIAKLAASSLPVVDLWNTNDQVLTQLRIYCGESPTHPLPIVSKHVFGRPPIVPLQAAAKKIAQHLHYNGPLQIPQ